MPNIKTHLFLKKAIFGLMYLICAVYAMSYFLQNSHLGDAYYYTRFDAMVGGYAKKPFVYRQLVPSMVRVVGKITPKDMQTIATQKINQLRFLPSFKKWKKYVPWFEEIFPRKGKNYLRLIACLIVFGFLIGYMYYLYALGRALFPQLPAIGLFTPFFGILAFTSFGYQWQYIYDIPCLCLSTACFYYLYTKRFIPYFIVFLLAIINKETAIFSLIFFVIWYYKSMNNRTFATLWVGQCLIYIFVKVIITMEYINNRGHFLEHNTNVVLARDLLGEADIHKITIIAVLWLLFTFRWQEKPLFLKRALWLFPLMYLAYFLYGFPHEYRVFFDIHAPLVLLATHTLIQGTGIASSPLFSAKYFPFEKSTHDTT